MEVEVKHQENDNKREQARNLAKEIIESFRAQTHENESIKKQVAGLQAKLDKELKRLDEETKIDRDSCANFREYCSRNNRALQEALDDIEAIYTRSTYAIIFSFIAIGAMIGVVIWFLIGKIGG